MTELEDRSVMRPPPIERLNEALINQIAAGEVVERPASVLKELIENSLDAGATRIDILLKEGGIDEIQIIDDGWGISENYLPLALERHATSKIRTPSDLEAITSFGFRGEALASIASVSEVKLVSRTREMARSAGVRASFGLCDGVLEFESGPVGTQVSVSHLFEKIPARRKFLRSASTEFSHCARLVKEMALANSHVGFFLHHQGRLVQSYPPGSRLSRFQDCLKTPWEPVHWIESTDGLSVEALLSPPEWLSDRGELFIFLNNRPVRNKTITGAIRNAYEATLGSHHEPSGAIHLTMKPGWVDVNVHPQKWEVRILRQEALYAWLLQRVKAHLPASNLVATAGESTNATESFVRDQPESYLSPPNEHYLLDGPEILFVVDRRRLVEVARYNLWRDRGPGSRQLAHPCVVRTENLTLDRDRLVESLSRMGFQVRPFDNNEWAITAVPSPLAESEVEPFFKACIERCQEGLTELCLADLAALTSNNAEESWSLRQLSEQAVAIKRGLLCPHGKPVAYSIAKTQLNRHFGDC